jgi:hypothetical protein
VLILLGMALCISQLHQVDSLYLGLLFLVTFFFWLLSPLVLRGVFKSSIITVDISMSQKVLHIFALYCLPDRKTSSFRKKKNIFFLISGNAACLKVSFCLILVQLNQIF